MNCPRKIREEEAEAAAPVDYREKRELEELEVLLEGRYVAEDYLS